MTEAAPGRLWAGLAALLAAASLLAWWLPAEGLDWQPTRAATEPWRAWTAAFVHWSPTHLTINLIGTVVVAALGLAARLPARVAVAWAVAWPLTQAGLWLRPELAHYGGLSGVLHAGVACAAAWLVLAARERQQAIGLAIALGLTLKVLTEAPWKVPVSMRPSRIRRVSACNANTPESKTTDVKTILDFIGPLSAICWLPYRASTEDIKR